MWIRRLLPLLVLGLAACGRDEGTSLEPAAEGPPYVQCVHYPLAWMASRLAPDLDVRFDAPAGHDPAFWKPSGTVIRSFQQATLILDNGAGYAKWMQTATLPSARIVDTSASFRDKLIDVGGGVTHSHGPGGDHTHGDIAFTTWLDFRQCAQQLDAVFEALANLAGRGVRAWDTEEDARERLNAVAKALGQLDQEMKRIGEAWGAQPLLASHPVYQYLARAYGLNVKSEHFEPGTVPSEEQLEILASLRKVFPARFMLWEAEPGAETRARLRALDIECVVFDPCGGRPERGDFVSVMQANVERLGQALQR